MNKLPVLHYFKDKRVLYKSYGLALLPLLIYGFYKNGIFLYVNDLVSFKRILLPLYFYGISILMGYLVAILSHTEKKQNILMALICGASVSLNTNMIIYPILLFGLLFIVSYVTERWKIVFNKIALVRLGLVLALMLGLYSYMNIAEKLGKFNYGLGDVILGRGVSGIASSSIILIGIGLVILSFNKYYKKEIAISSIVVFGLLGFSYVFLTKNYDFLSVLLNGTVYFSLVFIGPDVSVSPYYKKGMVVYGVLIGLLTFILTLVVNSFEAGIIAVLLVSFLIPIINKIGDRQYLK